MLTRVLRARGPPRGLLRRSLATVGAGDSGADFQPQVKVDMNDASAVQDVIKEVCGSNHVRHFLLAYLVFGALLSSADAEQCSDVVHEGYSSAAHVWLQPASDPDSAVSW
jgi:hypothetical protein